MSTNAALQPSPLATDSPSTLTPDLWVAATTAAAQTYINVGKAGGSTNVAAIRSAIGKAQSQNAISQPVATQILDFLQSPAGTTLVANSIVLANRAFAYITTYAAASASPIPAHIATTVAVASTATGHEAAASPGAQAGPSMTMTGQQVVAIVESTNYVLGKLGKPAIPRGLVKTADAPGAAGAGSGSGDEPGAQSSSVGSLILGVAVEIATAGFKLTPEGLVSAVGAEVLIAGVEAAAEFVEADTSGVTIQGETTQDGTGSGSRAPGPGDEGYEADDGSDDGGGGSGEGIDDKPGHQPD